MSSKSISHLFCIIVTTGIGAEFGDVRPLDKALVCALQLNYVRLLNDINCDAPFVSELASSRVSCITQLQRDHLVNIVQPRERNIKLLDFLTRKSVASFKQFIKVLNNYQAHLVPLLDTYGGEMCLICK